MCYSNYFIKYLTFLKFLPITFITRYSRASLLALQKSALAIPHIYPLIICKYTKMCQYYFNISTDACESFDNQLTHLYLNIKRIILC